MQELGSVQNASQGAYAYKATPGRKVHREEGGDSRQSRQDAASERVATSIRAILAQTVESVENTVGDTIANERTTASSDRNEGTLFRKIDHTFGVEQLTYKNMWKVLKTVVKEIGEIKEANSGRFFLGVSERLDKATTLMQFGSIVDYLGQESTFNQNIVSSEAAGGAAGQITANPAMSLQAQANIVPDTALHLLNGTR